MESLPANALLAANRINSHIREAPLDHSPYFSELTGPHKHLFGLEHGDSVNLMRKIKTQFDPHNILNPGKIFDR